MRPRISSSSTRRWRNWSIALISRTRDTAFRDTVDRFVQGEPDALLLVEFADDDPKENLRLLDALEGVAADLGLEGGVVRAEDEGVPARAREVRKASTS